jgi:hypothetical protein
MAKRNHGSVVTGSRVGIRLGVEVANTRSRLIRIIALLVCLPVVAVDCLVWVNSYGKPLDIVMTARSLRPIDLKSLPPWWVGELYASRGIFTVTTLWIHHNADIAFPWRFCNGPFSCLYVIINIAVAWALIEAAVFLRSRWYQCICAASPSTDRAPLKTNLRALAPSHRRSVRRAAHRKLWSYWEHWVVVVGATYCGILGGGLAYSFTYDWWIGAAVAPVFGLWVLRRFEKRIRIALIQGELAGARPRPNESQATGLM